MQNKKKCLLGVVLLSVLGLTACNEVVSKPTDYNENIVLDGNGNGLDVPNNDMSKVYDAIRSGALAGDVLDEFLYQYAVSAFGAYNKVTAKTADVVTLKEVAKLIKDSCSDQNDINTLNVETLKSGKANEFVKNHKAYWTLNEKNERISYNAQGEAQVVAETADADKLEYTRVFAKWETIEARIAKTLYDAISGGAYNTRNVFEEKEYVYALFGNMKKVADPKTLAATASYTGLLWPEVEDVDVFTQDVKDINDVDSKILHRANYQQHFELSDLTESSSNNITYVEDDIIPDIYRTLLVEQYLLDESYQLLGRSYARKVNILKLSGSTVYTKGASYLMDAFINNKIFNSTGAPTTLDDFKVVSSAWNGAFMSETGYATSPEYNLWKQAGLEDEYLKTAKDNSKYFVGTAYGDMMEKYDKIDDNPAISENESEFTGSSAYSKEVGKEIQTREIAVKDYTTTGWYIKNGGLNDLPESIRSRLFNISVANALNQSAAEKAAHERYSNGTYDASKDANNYIARINGKTYLKVGTKANDADAKNDILFVDGDNYYIIQVEEAASSSALSKTDAKSFLHLEGYGAVKMEEIVNEVVKIVGDSDSFRTLAKKFWLEAAKISYHDQVIYNYFKANFPELFK